MEEWKNGGRAPAPLPSFNKACKEIFETCPSHLQICTFAHLLILRSFPLGIVMMRHTPDRIWSEILSELSDAAREDVYLRQVKPVELTENQLTVSVPALYTQEQIEERFLRAINSSLEKLMGAGCTLNFTIAKSNVKRAADLPAASSSASATMRLICTFHSSFLWDDGLSLNG